MNLKTFELNKDIQENLDDNNVLADITKLKNNIEIIKIVNESNKTKNKDHNLKEMVKEMASFDWPTLNYISSTNENENLIISDIEKQKENLDKSKNLTKSW